MDISATSLVEIVIVIFSGLAIGNYATNPIYRLPRKEPLFERKPYCGECGNELVAKDLLPVISWLSTWGKCRYCGAGIPLSYLLVELAIPVVFILSYLQFGFGEHFLLLSAGGSCVVMLVAMYANDRFFCNRTFLASLFFGALHRTLDNGSIFPFIIGGFIALVIGLVVRFLLYKIQNGDRSDLKKLPGYVKLMAAAGLWLL